ncbi:MCE family protein [Mycobacterium sherrisii]|uniref:MCE-family protein MCE3A n=1 Tax=Mycobacterium sherrisii TaxID=243061 RepID=A0A1E3SSP0_9MYCO|nr:MCE family protein [Mycobacterium sherrisii]MCV7032302.1 MCE family protein [Mycobacterium sherrisii]MEC4764269.1 MCE family protein [Mycobacterium sherrisii]ODR05142.1 MCE-family protein MCE3A [Mycobacterium sherrisii]ORW74607.1 MCE-family protein MCE3A [Mycobacterium sherrisii]
MESSQKARRFHPGWWTLVLIAVLVCSVVLSAALFAGTFRSFVPVTLASGRAGLVMEAGAKVKMLGVAVGRVSRIEGGRQPVRLQLDIDPDQASHIPANVEAEIRATTAFGAKYVELIPPSHPSSKHLVAGAVLQSRNVSTEVNTVFESLVGVLHQIDPSKLNAVLGAIADGVRGQGGRIGQATTDANQVLLAVNPRMDTVAANFGSLQGFSDAYAAAAKDIMSTLDGASTTSTTITNESKALDALLLNVIGFSRDAVDVIAPNEGNLVNTVNLLSPTTSLLLKYNPEYTCLLVGSKYFLDNGGYTAFGGNGRSEIADAALLFGKDPYKFPQNLPIVAAKGGPGGKPGCGSLPDAAKQFPVRQLVTNTGWGTGLDIRPNPGTGHPFYINWLPTTRGVPQPPRVGGNSAPAIGPVPYPGAPPYGAPLFGADGTPLWAPPPPGAPPPPVPGVLNPPPPYGTGTGPPSQPLPQVSPGPAPQAPIDPGPDAPSSPAVEAPPGP